jgi:signal transduction histidine kinase
MSRAVAAARLQPGIRARLTLLYGGMFLLAGGALIAIFYVLFRDKYPCDNALAHILAGSRKGSDVVTTFPSGIKLNIPLSDVQDIYHRWDGSRAAALSSLVDECLLAVVPMATLAAVSGWVMAGRALRPVRQITQTARRVVGRNLRERIALSGPTDEIKELADTFDAMLERLDASFEGQRQFVANASHELRTPLATNRTLLEVAVTSGRVPANLRPLVDAVLATNERSELIIDGLLTLASSESKTIRRVPVDLSDIAAEAVEQTAAEAATARITVNTAPDPATTTGDPVLLERLALNLVRNGIRHNHPGGWVKVGTAAGVQPGDVELVVANSGPLVQPQQLSLLFEPFRRLGRDRTASEGVGLGLSIVRSVVQAHTGRLVATAHESGGLHIRVCLPAAPPDSPAPPTDPHTVARPALAGAQPADPPSAARRVIVGHQILAGHAKEDRG